MSPLRPIPSSWTTICRQHRARLWTRRRVKFKDNMVHAPGPVPKRLAFGLAVLLFQLEGTLLHLYFFSFKVNTTRSQVNSRAKLSYTNRRLAWLDRSRHWSSESMSFPSSSWAAQQLLIVFSKPNAMCRDRPAHYDYVLKSFNCLVPQVEALADFGEGEDIE